MSTDCRFCDEGGVEGGGLCGGVSMATERVGTDCALASGAEATDESLNELPRCF